MKKIVIISLVAALSIIAGCANTSQPKLDTFNGLSEIELVRQKGAPHRYYSVGESRFLTYEHREQKIYKGVHTTAMMGLPPLLTGSPARVVQRRCITTFEIAGGKVVDWHAEGDACSAN